nr:uncharacterized protein LOC117992886 [Maniola hyperantus]
MTVVQAPNVIAARGQKQVGQNVSAERGQLITMCGIVNAAGNSIPPVFIYPRARFQESMLTGGLNGCIGFANSPTSGWMTGTLFVKVLEHLQKHTRCNKNDKILLLLDNHESHCTIDCINFCRDNGIVLVTFPPHCTHRLQPLDVSVMGPFKQKLAVSQNDWLINHPGKTRTIHDLAGIVTPAYNASFTPNNITSGFKKSGIFPVSRNAFTDDDFDCSEVTNRPIPALVEQPAEIPVDTQEVTQETIQTGVQAEVATDLTNHYSDKESFAAVTLPEIISPEMVRPYPKADPRKEGSRGRKKGKSRILTGTPEKLEIEAAYLERQNILQKSGLRKRKPKIQAKRSKTLIPNNSSDD